MKSKLFLLVLLVSLMGTVQSQKYQSEERPGADGLIVTYNITHSFERGGQDALLLHVKPTVESIDKIIYRKKTYPASHFPEDVILSVNKFSVKSPGIHFEIYNGDKLLKTGFTRGAASNFPWTILLDKKGEAGNYQSVLQAKAEAAKEGDAMLRAGTLKLKITKIDFVGSYDDTKVAKFLTGK
ncbi:hypothetical protein [Aridibaculum aurantiacum]|uniref:hypothetical protein n=1 Tax=Aridibaculum aurantiacum TaxID=2810307 RepID=UPI001A97318D|nr:hypothetical protein [Aridibaculum aurantiacum]